MLKLKYLLLCSLIVATLAGCGQKGPLYLPSGETEPAPVEDPLPEEDDDGA
jgi:predicted small lipoprotein YifL